MKKFFSEFKEFALRGNAIELAVGLIIGTAFTGLVNSLVNDIISPFIGIFATTDLSGFSFSLFGAEIKYGAFLTTLINFIIMALIIFLLVKGMNALAKTTTKKSSKV